MIAVSEVSISGWGLRKLTSMAASDPAVLHKPSFAIRASNPNTAAIPARDAAAEAW